MSNRSDPEGLRLGILAEASARAAILATLPTPSEPANVVIVDGRWPHPPRLGPAPLVVLLRPRPNDQGWLARADAIATHEADLPAAIARAWLGSGRGRWGSLAWLEVVALALGEVSPALVPLEGSGGEATGPGVEALGDPALLATLAQQTRGRVRPGLHRGLDRGPAAAEPEPLGVITLDLGEQALLIVHPSAESTRILAQTLALAPLLRPPPSLPTAELSALLHDLSHDVRTPMFALRLVQQLLKRRDPEDELIERLEEAIVECLRVVEVCVQQGRHLLGRSGPG
ncbi:MAG TPA: hypothetical protein ENK18_27255 [Deltaproteobacteria bacterium]|nr:hypothetical protein [Deltaproteobacteria bacterium]